MYFNSVDMSAVDRRWWIAKADNVSGEENKEADLDLADNDGPAALVYTLDATTKGGKKSDPFCAVKNEDNTRRRRRRTTRKLYCRNRKL